MSTYVYDDDGQPVMRADDQATCPKTGRSASACDSPDHRNCPDLRRAWLSGLLGRRARLF